LQAIFSAKYLQRQNAKCTETINVTATTSETEILAQRTEVAIGSKKIASTVEIERSKNWTGIESAGDPGTETVGRRPKIAGMMTGATIVVPGRVSEIHAGQGHVSAKIAWTPPKARRRKKMMMTRRKSWT
jgi:hypothetical protein